MTLDTFLKLMTGFAAILFLLIIGGWVLNILIFLGVLLIKIILGVLVVIFLTGLIAQFFRQHR